MSNQDQNIVNYPNSLETRVALVEMAIVNINSTLVRLEQKIDKGFSDLSNEIKDVRKDMKFDFRWHVVSLAGLAAVMAHGFHWF